MRSEDGRDKHAPVRWKAIRRACSALVTLPIRNCIAQTRKISLTGSSILVATASMTSARGRQPYSISVRIIVKEARHICKRRGRSSKRCEACHPKQAEAMSNTTPPLNLRNTVSPRNLLSQMIVDPLYRTRTLTSAQ